MKIFKLMYNLFLSKFIDMCDRKISYFSSMAELKRLFIKENIDLFSKKEFSSQQKKYSELKDNIKYWKDVREYILESITLSEDF